MGYQNQEGDCCGLDDCGSVPGRGRNFALSTTMSKTPIKHFHSPVQWVSQAKRLECDGDCVSSCAEVRNVCSIHVLCHMSSWDKLG